MIVAVVHWKAPAPRRVLEDYEAPPFDAGIDEALLGPAQGGTPRRRGVNVGHNSQSHGRAPDQKSLFDRSETSEILRTTNRQELAYVLFARFPITLLH